MFFGKPAPTIDLTVKAITENLSGKFTVYPQGLFFRVQNKIKPDFKRPSFAQSTGKSPI